MPGRFLGYVGDKTVRPRLGLGFTGFVGRHRGIAGGEASAHDMRPREVAQKTADAAASNDAVQAFVNIRVNGDSEFF